LDGEERKTWWIRRRPAVNLLSSRLQTPSPVA
jgi:hypothetical protein